MGFLSNDRDEEHERSAFRRDFPFNSLFPSLANELTFPSPNPNSLISKRPSQVSFLLLSSRLRSLRGPTREGFHPLGDVFGRDFEGGGVFSFGVVGGTTGSVGGGDEEGVGFDEAWKWRGRRWSVG